MSSDHYIPLPVLQERKTDFEAIRRRLSERQGRDYWRGLDELAETPEFQDYVEHEFPADADVMSNPITRRTFLKLMSASFALAMFGGCRRPLEKIIPYNEAPEDLIPGKPLYFASALPWRGFGRGVLVESHMGRPTKIEGNPEHPDSLGATDVFMQAATLQLYDPDRSQSIWNKTVPRTWEDFLNNLRVAMAEQGTKRGSGLWIMTESTTSPTLIDQMESLLRRYPAAHWVPFEPISRDNVYEGSHLAFGRAMAPQYRLAEADVIVSLDADFLYGQPGSLRYAREFAQRRSVREPHTMNRLYAAEPSPTVTGTCADERLPLRADALQSLAWRLAAELGLAVPKGAPKASSAVEKWIRTVAEDLRRHRGRGLVMAGDALPPETHALVHAMNEMLGNAGRTVVYTDPVEARAGNQTAALRDLTQAMKAGTVDLLVIIGGNPVYDAPADLAFAEGLRRVRLSIRLGEYEDETSELCDWHLPKANALESWSDLRAFDGTASIVQPLIEPLYEGKTPHELLSAMADGVSRTPHELVQTFWNGQSVPRGTWEEWLNGGVIPGTAFPVRSVTARVNLASLQFPPAGALPDVPAYGSSGNGFGNTNAPPSNPYVSGSPSIPAYVTPAPAPLEVVFRPDPSIWDGRFANNGWLQEVPKPITKMTWDNPVVVSPALAERLGLNSTDVVELTLDGRSAKGAVFIVAGQADQCITVFTGFGRRKAGRVGNGVGFDMYALRSSKTLWRGSDVKLRRTGEQYFMASTQTHYTMQGRDLVRETTLAEYLKNPEFAKRPEKTPSAKETLYNYTEPPASPDYAWAMGIDLNLCIGCNACVVACQAENNIPVVGKEQAGMGRHMHWIRVDRYYKGNLENPQSFNQPVPCMHCEDAPCEVVCPVDATLHDSEGLNEMVYNRCIGTRYCSNNCPYKVRRFNFLYFSDYMHEKPLELNQNPDVTVRYRGVMEKCTYCVQRINAAKITAEKDGRLVKDGEIVPACMQACPTRTISFGNLRDKNSAVNQVKSEPRDYGILSELGTRPRTTYQAKVSNRHPDLT